MDNRWQALASDSKRDVRVILHQSASIGEVRRGEATDGVDLTPFVSDGSHTLFDCSITLHFNYELYSETQQPAPDQVLEVQLPQEGTFFPVWIGVIDAVSSYMLERGVRSVQLSARSRDSLDIFRTTKRVTPLFPQMTNMGYVAERIALGASLEPEEILLPGTAFGTSHTNTQLSEMSAWDMLNAVCLPIGWTPFIDGLGRLRAASREVQSIATSVELEEIRIVKVNAQRQRPPITRMRLRWLNPELKKAKQQSRMLAEAIATTGWFLPWFKTDIWFSDDKTQRAEATYLEVKQSANQFGFGFIQETYTQTQENGGKLVLWNWGFVPTLALMIASLRMTAEVRDQATTAPGPVEPVGRRAEAWVHMGILTIMIMIGTGKYEIWGMPYEWVHARNTTDAFNADAAMWVDNPAEIESDFIMNEPHAQAVAVRELIYQIWNANKWSVEIVDDPRLEFGDVLQFPDGTRLYIENLSRKLGRGSDSVLKVDGFLLGNMPSVEKPIANVTPIVPEITPPGSTPPGTGTNLTRQAPNRLSVLQSIYNEGGWNLSEYNEDAPNGRGAFTERAVNTLHAGDANWGHIRKRPGHNQYNGHAVDAINYKRNDGLGEVYDIVTGSGNVCWNFVSISKKAADAWYF